MSSLSLRSVRPRAVARLGPGYSGLPGSRIGDRPIFLPGAVLDRVPIRGVASPTTDGSTHIDVVGRSTEIAAIDSFLARVAREAGALVFEGRAGIGKTTVWREAFARAAERGVILLSCRPAEAEAKLAFGALVDLLDPVADATLPHLPEPQRAALEVALMRRSPLDVPPSARAVAMAALSVLGAIENAAPVVLAIDDQQWLDRPSAAALAFALRRLSGRRVGVVATVRAVDDEVADPLCLRSTFAERLQRVPLPPLGSNALREILRGQLAVVLPGPDLRRIAETSGGNPFFALEQTRALLQAGGQVRPGAPLPVSETLASLVARRLDGLPRHARRLLLVASALADPTVQLLHAAEGGEVMTSLRRAERAGILEVGTHQLRFTHPLFASAIYSAAPPDVRRAVHQRLAGVVATAEERALHLALAAVGPDAQVARTLEEASQIARRRGAPDSAAELQDRAADLTPVDDVHGRRRRRTAAAEHFFHAGGRAHARAILENILGDPLSRVERSRALHLLGQIRGQEDSFGDAMAHLEEALALADGAASRVPIRCDLAFATFNAGDLARATALARDALADAERLGDPGVIADALGVVVMGEFMAGRGCDRAGMERALRLEDRRRPNQLLMRPASVAGILAMLDGRLAEADAMLQAQCAWASERGEESELPFLLFNRARLEWWRGDFPAAARCAEETIALALQSGSETMRLVGLAWRAAARGGMGDVAGARADLLATRTLIDATGYVQGEVFLRMNEAALELSRGDFAAVERTLAPLVSVVEQSASGAPDGAATSFGVPIAGYFLPDAVEALVALEQVARAATLVEWFACRAEQVDRWGSASVARCRSVLAVAQGDLDAAASAAEDAVARWRALEMPIELGRALLVLGKVRRRRGERRRARDAIVEALAIFERHGAILWVGRASEELHRIPIRRGAPDELTATEEQVATLAGAGRTNREIAQALFVSPKTVEANLARVYRKLDIRCRAELGVRMLARRAARGAET